MWVKPDPSDTSITIAGNTVAYTSTTDPQTFDIGGIDLERLSAVSNWSHIAVVASSSTDALLYVDGQKSDPFNPEDGDSPIFNNDFNGSLDEMRVYYGLSLKSRPNICQVAHFSIFLNKYHAVPIGPDFTMSSSSNDTGTKRTAHKTLRITKRKTGR